MAIQFGDVTFLLKKLQVATLSAAGTYGTPVTLDVAQTLEFSPKFDTDLLKGNGFSLEALAVMTDMEGKISTGTVNRTAAAIMFNWANQTTGTTPNRKVTVKLQAGLVQPYFGMLGTMIGPQGNDLVIGFYRCLATSLPAFTAEQNKFHLPEIPIMMIAKDENAAVMQWQFREYGAASVDITDFNTWFT